MLREAGKGKLALMGDPASAILGLPARPRQAFEKVAWRAVSRRLRELPFRRAFCDARTDDGRDQGRGAGTAEGDLPAVLLSWASPIR